MDKIKSSKFKIVISMIIWGSIGVFVREIDLSSLQIAFLRAFIGSVFLIFISFLKKEKINIKVLKDNIFYLAISGIFLGINWYLLFQAMRFTTISNAVLSYYFAPVFIVLFSAFFFKEKITGKNIIYLIVSIAGLFIIMKSNGEEGLNGFNHLKGIMYGLSGAVIYAFIVMLNKYIKGLSGLQTTLFQLLISTITLSPFIFTNKGDVLLALTSKSLIFILTLGVVHTGIAYLLYFSSIINVKGKSIAILSYLDPIVAVVTAFIFLGESMGVFQVFGALMILISSYLSEISSRH